MVLQERAYTTELRARGADCSRMRPPDRNLGRRAHLQSTVGKDAPGVSM